MNARRGLQRIGLREWQVEGPHGTYVIERDSPRRWYVRAAHIPKQFYNDKFRRYSMAELLRLEAANTLTGASRWRAVSDLADMSGRPKSAVREMANKMRQGRSALLLERCRAEQAELMMAMVPDRGRGANDGRWSTRKAVNNFNPDSGTLPVASETGHAHSGGELTTNPGEA